MNARGAHGIGEYAVRGVEPAVWQVLEAAPEALFHTPDADGSRTAQEYVLCRRGDRLIETTFRVGRRRDDYFPPRTLVGAVAVPGIGDCAS